LLPPVTTRSHHNATVKKARVEEPRTGVRGSPVTKPLQASNNTSSHKKKKTKAIRYKSEGPYASSKQQNKLKTTWDGARMIKVRSRYNRSRISTASCKLWLPSSNDTNHQSIYWKCESTTRKHLHGRKSETPVPNYKQPREW